MAYNKRRQTKKNFVAIPIESALSLGTLGDATIIKADIPTGVLTEDLFCISADVQISVNGVTAGELLPSTWRICHSDYDVTEVKKALEIVLLGPGNKIEQERSRRLVRKGGQFKNDPLVPSVLQMDGPGTKRLKLRFVVQNGKSLQI